MSLFDQAVAQARTAFSTSLSKAEPEAESDPTDPAGAPFADGVVAGNAAAGAVAAGIGAVAGEDEVTEEGAEALEGIAGDMATGPDDGAADPVRKPLGSGENNVLIKASFGCTPVLVPSS